jgi:hypothetical protein
MSLGSERIMPSRLGVLAIIGSWLVCMSWLFVREIAPHLAAGQPPAFFTDVTDEFGGTKISWNIWRNGESIGAGFSQVRPHPDRTFELTSTMVFEKFQVLNVGEITKIAGRYRISKDGKLLELATEGKIKIAGQELKGELKGTVVDGMLEPKIYLNDIEAKLDFLKPQPVSIGEKGSVVNTMHLINKIPGLYAGRSWQVPLIDPLGALIPGQKNATKVLIAKVEDDVLEWQHKSVACYRIDYGPPGKKTVAQTWVRRADGLVLQQEANQDGIDLVFVREANK